VKQSKQPEQRAPDVASRTSHGRVNPEQSPPAALSELISNPVKVLSA
jgi:hypothetical protein